MDPDATSAAGGPAGPRLRARGIEKWYGRTRALARADLDLEPGTIVAVVGPNGAGKSTLLACLAGVLPHRGSVVIDGRPARLAAAGTVAYLPQRPRLPAAATVNEVLQLFSALAGGVPGRASLPDGFVPDGGRAMATLSGGQAQRVALAAALSGRPGLILLDEPLVNLDVDGRLAAMEALAAHRAAGASIVVASPTAVDVLAMADRVVLVEHGEAHDAGPASSFLAGLAMTIWVRRDGPDGPAGPDIEALSRLPGVTLVRSVGHWAALDCAEESAMGLLEALAGLGIPADRIRFGAPGAPGAPGPASPSPTGAGT